jgi:rSAM/selenodomain-associated transferase 1
VYPTVPPPARRLLVFARLPEHGRVKTRLAAEIGEDRSLAVYEAMLRDLLRSIGDPTPELEIEVAWAPTAAASGAALARAFGSLPTSMQAGATLGDRLSIAFTERFFFHRTGTIVAVGVDDPRLPRELIDHAFALLDCCDWVVGPAADGGYYLIGCRAAAFDNEIFSGIDWGSSRVLDATLGKIHRWGSTVAVLPVRRDIDVAEDLKHFAGATASNDGDLFRLLKEWGFPGNANRQPTTGNQQP